MNTIKLEGVTLSEKTLNTIRRWQDPDTDFSENTDCIDQAIAYMSMSAEEYASFSKEEVLQAIAGLCLLKQGIKTFDLK